MSATLVAACEDPFNILVDKYFHVRSSTRIDIDRLPSYPATEEEVKLLLENTLNIDGVNAGKKYSIYDEVATLQKRIADFPIIDRSRFQDSRTRLSDMMATFMPSFCYYRNVINTLTPDSGNADPETVMSIVDSTSPPHSDDESPALPDILIDQKSAIKSEPAVTRNHSQITSTEPTTPSTSSESDESAFALQTVTSIDPTPSEAFKKGEGIPSELRAQRVISREALKPKPIKRKHSDSSR